MHRELPSLAECTVTAWIVAFERLLLSVDIHVFLEVLGQGELFEAEHTDMVLGLLVRGDVASKREAGSIGLFAPSYLASKGSIKFLVVVTLVAHSNESGCIESGS